MCCALSQPKVENELLKKNDVSQPHNSKSHHVLSPRSSLSQGAPVLNKRGTSEFYCLFIAVIFMLRNASLEVSEISMVELITLELAQHRMYLIRKCFLFAMIRACSVELVLYENRLECRLTLEGASLDQLEGACWVFVEALGFSTFVYENAIDWFVFKLCGPKWSSQPLWLQPCQSCP